MTLRKVWMVWVLILSLAACTAAGQPGETPVGATHTPETSAPVGGGDDPLSGTGWLLETVKEKPALPDARPTLDFEEGRLSGSDGCNRYGGSYVVEGATIAVNKDMAVTMMACAEPIMEQASAFLAALTEAARYQVAGEQLTLLDAAGSTLATLTRQSRELEGTSWTVVGYNNGQQAVVSVIAGSTVTIEWAGGTLSGAAGCNRYTAAYEVSAEGVRIGPAASTRMMCAEPAGVMEQEAQFLKALESAASYRIDGDRLELRTADGALAATGTRGLPE